ncbi:fasciclin domain-containing protein [Tamlana sp. I1]|uniref:fasciclin domain-containing protein n=1 Tax=Tamlana sp. I1 TaxID=2762061 RepID=UPI00189076DA|nr:fasciclin domain-containing protein [Tamlana sp. I1]
MKTQVKFLVSIFSILLLIVSCSNDDDNSTPINPLPTKNIVETAQGADSLSSLVAALTVADKETDSDLIGTLSSTGPFTVFAPTNDAFNSLLSQLDGYDSLDDFDTTEGRKMLAIILKYHVVSGAAVFSNQLNDNQEISTVQGGKLMVDLTPNGVYIEDATDASAMVSTADILATNGVVHVINKVLLPQEILDMLNAKTLVELVVENDNLSILEAAVIKTGLVDTLNSSGPFTVFAPTNDAFVALLEALGNEYNSLDDFDTEAEIDLLRNIVLYHAIPSAIYSTDLSETSVETAFTGNNIKVIASGNTYVIEDTTGEQANILAADVMASNGVAHVIDRVLLPN